ncbi:MAG: DoxX family protein [Anaerolineales bacterium]|nr:DoxX family protein [Anaerolineales bacterium]
MKITFIVFQLSLVGIYGAFGFLKTFRTQKAKEQMPWARNRSEFFIRFVGVSELVGALVILLAVLTGGFPWLTILAAAGFTLIQILAIFTEHLPKKEYKVLPFNVMLLSFSIFVLASYL